MSLITVKNAYKEYQSKSDKKIVLSGFNMNVEEGDVYAMMGSSGCGKTTLISCLVGVSNLDSGDIEIFGEPTRRNKSRIGYMPQETALVTDFRISEMIWYFGTLYSLSSEKIKSRLTFLTELLQLPSGEKLIRECSGGQMRRISFALTLVHEPELLILDEPTVGLDPLLRNKIWDYFNEISRTRNVTILLSTHYIEEARYSTKVGLMRKGIQIAEDTPANILLMMETNNLEEAFLRLSEKQEHDTTNHNVSSCSSVEVKTFQGDLSTPSSHHLTKKSRITPAKTNQLTIMKALVMKNLLKFTHNTNLILISVLIPIIGCLCLHFGIGGTIKGLTLGFVNNEVSSIEECFNRSLVTFDVHDYECTLHKVSCRFINEFDESIASKKYFKNYDEALRATKSGAIVGFVYFKPNFTEYLPFFEGTNDVNGSGEIQVFLDQSDLQVTTLMRKKLYETYSKFSEHLMSDCGKAKEAANTGMTFEAAFGQLDFDFRSTIIPGFLLGAYFSISTHITSTSIISARSDGTWHRTIVAGASPALFFWSHLIEGLLIMLLQFSEYFVYLMLFMPGNLTLNSGVLMTLLMLFTGLTGVTFGLLLSIALETVLAAYMVGQFYIYPVSFISGVMWPIEGVPIVLRMIGYILPVAFPVSAFRNVLTKDSTIYDQSVYLAFLVMSGWIVTHLLLALLIIREDEDLKTKKKK